ncbi:MAG: VanZ family protein [Clostridia bacterium]|nr:VanZ family protein [Clostridia bacterium]
MRLTQRTVNFIRFTAIGLFFIYLSILLYLTIFKRLYYASVTGLFLESYQFDRMFEYGFNLVPFRGIYMYLTNPPSFNIAMTNLVGNILAFVPMGFLLPVISEKARHYVQVILLSLSSSLIIEVLQLLLRVGSTDVDDLILNTLGGLIGYIGFYIVSRIIVRITTEEKEGDPPCASP